MNPLLVGECNPYQRNEEDAMRFAFHPDPPHASGGRLCHLILGLTERDYLRFFDRTDLCHPKWSIRHARDRALSLRFERHHDDVILVFGVKVAEAFGVSTLPFVVHRPGPVLVTLPHPSGRNTAWQQPGAIDRARRLLRELGVPCAAPTTEAA